MDSGTTTAGPEAGDRRSHIERINDWDNPAAILDVGEFSVATPSEKTRKIEE